MKILHAAALLLCGGAVAAQAVVGCTEETTCLGAMPLTRCLPTTTGQGSPCTLDYSFNTTGWCSCQSQACVRLTSPPRYPSKKQLLVIGDSISLGYISALSANMSDWEVTHAPSFTTGSTNNDNVNWHRQCIEGWIAGGFPQQRQWDAITINAGLHDLAYPDNEHLSLPAYQAILTGVLTQAANLVPKTTALVWALTTPVPTNPNASCVLLPGRLEKDVLAYNSASLAAIASTGLPAGRIGTCDLHSVITSVCGVGYSSCPIAQCGGPHFSEQGFALLGQAMAGCVLQAVEERGREMAMEAREA